ncbi:MAG: hypothetical protein IIU12_06440, partial [Prevotella sp.]|nr:hypothetical protein [Prevotella sp.]
MEFLQTILRALTFFNHNIALLSTFFPYLCKRIREFKQLLIIKPFKILNNYEKVFDDWFRRSCCI